MKYLVSIMLLGLLFTSGMSAHAEPAFVVQGELCVVVFTPEGGGDEVFTGDKVQGVAVDTGEKGPGFDAGKVTCQGYHGQPLDHAVVQRGACFLPGTPLGDVFTENGRLVMAPGGNWTLFCKFSPPDE